MESTSKIRKTPAAGEKKKKRKTMDADEKEKEPITLNVGGVKYMTFEETLKKSPKLKQLCFEEADKQMKDEEGNILINRDGELFNFLLKYLRHGKITLPAGFADTDALIEEALFYGLQELEKKLKDHMNKQNAILWVRVVSEEDTNAYHRITGAKTKFPKEINVLCPVDTFRSLKAFKNVYTHEEHFHIHGRSCINRNDLNTWQQDTYLSYFFNIPGNFSFVETLVSEGFEVKDSQPADFMMYTHKNSEVTIDIKKN